MLNEGWQVQREGTLNKLDARNKFLTKVTKIKDLDKYQIGMVRELIPKSRDDVDFVLIKYVTLEGRYKILMDSHFLILNHCMV